jgi:hypothetical protein
MHFNYIINLMSRLQRYKESVNRSIKKNLFECIKNKDFINKIQETDKLISILFLTVMNSQNKKNGVYHQGYHFATLIEFMIALTELHENRNYSKQNLVHSTEVCSTTSRSLTKQPDKVLKQIKELELSHVYKKDNLISSSCIYQDYNEIFTTLLLCTNRIIYQSFTCMKIAVNSNSTMHSFSYILDLYSKKISFDELLHDHKFELDGDLNTNIYEWYFKGNIKIKEQLNNLKKVKKDSLDKYINKKYGGLCESAMIIGWMAGCGDSKKNNEVKQSSKYFSIVYKLYLDFMNLEKDTMLSYNFSKNYIINIGFQKSYELFMENKHKFIESAMILDIYSSTVREILSQIENQVESVVEETSPDMKSNFTNSINT